MQEQRGAGWRDYYQATAGRPPRPTLCRALDLFAGVATARRAVDLGCGDGRDTIELLRRGWSVLAIDAEAAALARLRARPDLPEGAALSTRLARFEDAEWPAADLVNASFSLPLCARAAFPAVWRKITDSLVAGGRFAGQLYGERDSWARDPGITIFDEAGARALFGGYAVEMFEIEESDGLTPRGKPKHWHIFHAVARKLAD